MPRMIDLIRSSSVSATIMQAAARGALLLPPQEMIEILVHLATHNKVFGQQARLTLAGWDEKASREVAADPQAPKEILNYWIEPHNIRPALFPILLENPAISEETLAHLAATGTRELTELMLRSARVRRTAKILSAVRSNPNAAGLEIPNAEQPHSRSAELGTAAAASTAPLGTTEAGESSELPESADVSDAEVVAYLSEHAGELTSEGEQVFQPIGGFYEEFVPSSENVQEGQIEAEGAVEATTAVANPAPAESSAAAAPARAKAVVARKAHVNHEDERGSALQKISKLDVKGRIQLAMKGTKEERSILIRDGTKLVALAVLESPKISDGEVEKIASQKNVLEAVLRQIPMKRRYAKNYAVLRNLVFNPRTPLDVSLGLMKHLLVNDLRNLSGNKEVSETIRKLGLKMFKQKMDTSKKSSG